MTNTEAMTATEVIERQKDGYRNAVWAVRLNTQERYNAKRLFMWKVKKAALDVNKPIEPINPWSKKNVT